MKVRSQLMLLAAGVLWDGAAAGNPGEFSSSGFVPCSRPSAIPVAPRPRLGGLRLDSRENLLTGGKSGPAIVPGDPQTSLLIRAVPTQTRNSRCHGRRASSEKGDRGPHSMGEVGRAMAGRRGGQGRRLRSFHITRGAKSILGLSADRQTRAAGRQRCRLATQRD